ncbi:hypothetical protein AQ490_02390 [Wenjunlia vitaminophila]|uniref:FAD-binding PCMH-type domain-containing protein n=1 Tax=Wenjunlia vitaminophila TaxID=76728 RepID=A0A0T6LYH0_WENVI|nr:FAD-binding oxidoreductase [Wenjunlia vitaminophila]KRV51073.1 hypothetical protein AQ490_02390 [Wenjunlia vitaminophila]
MDHDTSDTGDTARRTVLLRAAGLATALLPVAACDDGAPAPARSSSPSSPGLPRPTPSRSPGPSASRRPPGPADWAALARDLDGELVRPDSPDYDTARLPYNPRFRSARPAAVAYCKRPEDVRQALRFGSRFTTALSVRGGGHCYAGWSTGSGLVIDTSEMNDISVSGTTTTIGAGARLMDVYQQLAGRGATIPAGSCPSVGIAGLALGGGHGVVSRAYGLTCDSMTGAEVVLADGRVAEVSADHHGDLFWALRGAGHGNFGVVTSLRFRTHPAADCATFWMSWPWSRARAVLGAWQEWASAAPDELWSHVTLLTTTGGAPRVTAGGLLLGGVTELERQLDGLVGRAGPVTSVTTVSRSYLDAMVYMAGCAEPSSCSGATEKPYTARSHFFGATPLPDAANRALVAQVERMSGLPTGGEGSVQLTALGGAVNRVGPGETAFVHRDSALLAQYIAGWEPATAGAVVARCTEWLDDLHGALAPYAGPGAYQNYTDPGLKDWRTAYYGANATRLARVKAAYDPGRLFRYPQAV